MSIFTTSRFIGRTAHVAHVAGHLLAREHAARRLALADRARRTMRQRVAVRRVAHREVPTLDRALEALALRDAGDVDLLADREDFFGLELAADFELADFSRFEAELPQTATAFHLRLRVVAGERLVDQRSALRAGTDLHRVVAVGLDGLHLRHAIRRRFDQRHRNRTAVVGEDAAHAAFAAYQSDTHGRFPLTLCVLSAT